MFMFLLKNLARKGLSITSLILDSNQKKMQLSILVSHYISHKNISQKPVGLII